MSEDIRPAWKLQLMRGEVYIDPVCFTLACSASISGFSFAICGGR